MGYTLLCSARPWSVNCNADNLHCSLNQVLLSTCTPQLLPLWCGALWLLFLGCYFAHLHWRSVSVPWATIFDAPQARVLGRSEAGFVSQSCRQGTAALLGVEILPN